MMTSMKRGPIEPSSERYVHGAHEILGNWDAKLVLLEDRHTVVMEEWRNMPSRLPTRSLTYSFTTRYLLLFVSSNKIILYEYSKGELGACLLNQLIKLLQSANCISMLRTQ